MLTTVFRARAGLASTVVRGLACLARIAPLPTAVALALSGWRSKIRFAEDLPCRVGIVAADAASRQATEGALEPAVGLA